MKKVIFLIIPAFVVLCALLFIGFYVLAYSKSNQLVTYVNKNGIDHTAESNWTEMSDLELLQIVPIEHLTENNYVEIKTKARPSLTAINKISFDYEITAIIKDWDSGETIETITQQRELFFEFSNLEWKLIDIQ